METNPSSSSSSPPAKKFDVFLSFRGEDTRNNFTGHLSLALRKIGLFNIFKDDYALPKGKDIGPELMDAIEDSQYAVVVLSENYATSSWCLKELAKIVECMGDSGWIRTIFYHVDPSHVRNVISSDVKKQQESSFWKALEEHAKHPSHSEDLEGWRNALVKVANQSGDHVEDHMDEAIFIKEFVAKISQKLGASIRTIDKGLIGMTSRLQQLDSYVLQSTTTNNVCFLGIHGMGGLGKSTLARAYYKQVSHKFDGGCFLQNVREVSEKMANGRVELQKQLLSNILEGDFTKIRHVDEGIDMIRSRFRRKKLLIVLDDVSKEEQLTALADEDNWFGSGTVIIVTTREDSFLTIRKYAIYRAEYLNPSDALQLFSWTAFRSVEPPKEYEKLSEQVIKYASYLPLALTVLGSLLGSKNTSEWESALQRLTKCPEKEIVEKLKISFDDLTETDQCIFLDIACFFNGDYEDKVIEILDSCGSHPIIGIRNLINKSLLSIQNDKIWMHDLLVEMGKGIVRKESGNNLGRQSRIWDENDLSRVVENEEGTNTVEGIKVFSHLGFKCDALSSMKNLRLLMTSSSGRECDEQKLKYLSNNLQYLNWNSFPYKRLPSSFQPLELVQLILDSSKIEQLIWNNCVKPLYNLKVIDLSYSKYLTKFEDFQVVPNLEKLNLCSCESLSEIHPSIKHLKKLIHLDLAWCTRLEKLPEEINGLASLQTLNLCGCEFLSEIHPSIKHLKKLIHLHLGGCTRLEKLPEEINGLASLQTLNLWGCDNLEKLPDNLAQLTSLRELDISDTSSIKQHLPSSINLMEMFESFNFDISKMIESDIEEDIYWTTTGKCVLPAWFSTEPESRYLMSVTSLDLSDGNFSGPEAFPEYFSYLVSLEKLRLDRNPFAVLPAGIKGFTNLTSLSLQHCESLRCLEAELLPSSLQKVNVNYCTSLASFLDPSKPCHLRCSYVSCVECTELVKRQDAKMTALASLSRFLDDQDFSKRRDDGPRFLFVISESDNELPSWFINQSSTGSITIKFDPNRRNSEFIGLALVFWFPSDSSLYSWVCNIRVDGGEKWKIKLDLGAADSLYARRDHLVLLCYPIWDDVFWMWEDHIAGIGNMLESAIWETLEFSFSRGSREEAWPGGMCGARLVYKEDIEELKQITTQYIHRVSAPAGAPALSPGSTPTTTAAAPEQGAGANEQAPAPPPGSSGSSMLFATVGSLLIALVIAYSSWF